MGNFYYCVFLYCGMIIDSIFNFDWEYIFFIIDDYVFDVIDDEDKFVFIYIIEIVGM